MPQASSLSPSKKEVLQLHIIRKLYVSVSAQGERARARASVGMRVRLLRSNINWLEDAHAGVHEQVRLPVCVDPGHARVRIFLSLSSLSPSPFPPYTHTHMHACMNSHTHEYAQTPHAGVCFRPSVGGGRVPILAAALALHTHVPARALVPMRVCCVCTRWWWACACSHWRPGGRAWHWCTS